MRWLMFAAIWAVSLINLLVALGGMIYLIGFWPGVIVSAILLAFRITIWIPPAAFVGALLFYELPWYWAMLIALPGLVVYLAIVSGVGGYALLRRFARTPRHAGRGD